MYIRTKTTQLLMDESSDWKHEDKCTECKHIGTRIRVVVLTEGQR
jgi:hypothetical protein